MVPSPETLHALVFPEGYGLRAGPEELGLGRWRGTLSLLMEVPSSYKTDCSTALTDPLYVPVPPDTVVATIYSGASLDTTGT